MTTRRGIYRTIPAAIIAAVLLTEIGCQTTGDDAANSLTPAPNSHTRSARIARVVDGDTLLLDSGESVRLIGIDAPELQHAEMPAERFGRDAAHFLRNLAEGHDCTLEFEETGATDKYGRTLAYVYVDGKMLNSQMVRDGYALVLTHFPFRRSRQFLKLEKYARRSHLGLWAGTLTDGRIANLAARYAALNDEGKAELDDILTTLTEKYPAGNSHAVSTAKPPGRPHEPISTTPDPEPAVVEADPDPALPWQKASDYIGKKVTIKGTVVSTYMAGTACFLNFSSEYQSAFCAVIFASALPLFPANPERHYRDRSVRVTGTVTNYKDRPQIIVEAPSQIEIIE